MNYFIGGNHDKKEPNLIIKFDNSNPTQAEKDQAFLDLFNCLAKIAIRIESEKGKTAKERKEIEKTLSKFHSETLLRVKKNLKNDKNTLELLKQLLLLCFVF